MTVVYGFRAQSPTIRSPRAPRTLSPPSTPSTPSSPSPPSSPHPLFPFLYSSRARVICSLIPPFLQESFLGGIDKPGQQIVSLVDEHNGNVSNSPGRAPLHPLTVESRVRVLPAHPPRLHSLWRFLVPQFKVAHTQIVSIVGQQLLQTGLGHIVQLNFSLSRCRCRRTALHNVLRAACNIWSTVRSPLER